MHGSNGCDYVPTSDAAIPAGCEQKRGTRVKRKTNGRIGQTAGKDTGTRPVLPSDHSRWDQQSGWRKRLNSKRIRMSSDPSIVICLTNQRQEQTTHGPRKSGTHGQCDRCFHPFKTSLPKCPSALSHCLIHLAHPHASTSTQPACTARPLSIILQQTLRNHITGQLRELSSHSYNLSLSLQHSSYLSHFSGSHSKELALFVASGTVILAA
jgi:hypothetical protein